MTKSSKSHYFLIILTYLQIYFTAGIILGWTSLVNLLQQNATYRFLCDDPSKSCIAEDIHLASIYSKVISAQLFAVIFLGAIYDHIGPKFLGICQIVASLGTLLITYGNPNGYIDFVTFGIFLQNICGSIYISSSLHISNLFPYNTNLVISLLSSMYALSSTVYFFVQIIHDHLELSLTNSLLPLVYIQLLLSIFSFSLPNTKFKTDDKCYFNPKFGGFYILRDNYIIKNYERILENTNSQIKSVKSENTYNYCKFLFNWISSKIFIKQLIYLSWLVSSTDLYVSTLSLQIKEILESNSSMILENVAYKYSTYFNIIVPFGCIAGILEGFIIDKFGIYKAAFFPCLFFILFNILKLIQNVKLQLFTFLVYTISQEMSYTALFCVINSVFPNDIIGTLIGFNNLFTSIPAYVVPQIANYFIINSSIKFIFINKITLIITILVCINFILFTRNLENSTQNNEYNSLI